MKKFVFRLASVLRVRTFELERARAQLAALEAERTRREGEVRREAERVVEGRRRLEEETKRGRDGERLALHADGVVAGRLRLARAERAAEDLRPALAEAHRRVVAARARVRSLERLGEQREAAHRREALAVEQAEIEELALARRAREAVLEGEAR